MKLLLDFFPVILFFVAYKFGAQNPEPIAVWTNHYLSLLNYPNQIASQQAPIFLATLVTIVASVVQILIIRLQKKSIETMQWLSLLIILVLGGATLFFNNENFIKWKPTLLYWMLASILVFSQIILKKNALKHILGQQLKLPDAVFNRMSWSWVVFFGLMGFLNLYVSKQFSTDVWVNFKLFGTLGATVIFVILQSFYLAKYLPNSEIKHTSGDSKSI